MPENALVHGLSQKTGETIIWSSEDGRVLGLQTLISLNANIIHELIVMKLYEHGKIDDLIKQRFLDEIYDTEKPIMRHTLLKVI